MIEVEFEMPGPEGGMLYVRAKGRYAASDSYNPATIEDFEIEALHLFEDDDDLEGQAMDEELFTRKQLAEIEELAVEKMFDQAEGRDE